MTIDTLFARAAITTWDQATWLKGARIAWPYLLIDADELTLAYVRRNFLPRLCEHAPGLQVMKLTKAPAKPPTQFPALKAGPWLDLLDSE